MGIWVDTPRLLPIGVLAGLLAFRLGIRGFDDSMLTFEIWFGISGSNVCFDRGRFVLLCFVFVVIFKCLNDLFFNGAELRVVGFERERLLHCGLVSNLRFFPE